MRKEENPSWCGGESWKKNENIKLQHLADDVAANQYG